MRLRDPLILPVVAGALGLLGAVSCNRDNSDDRGLFATVDSVGFRQVAPATALCHSCIQVQRVAVLGDSMDPGMLVDTWLRVVKDSLNNYWVSQPRTVKVYDPHGAFLRQVGRAGSGPLEFRMPLPLHTDQEGRVHILDANRRETIVSADFTYFEDHPFPGRPQDVVALPDGRYVANMWVASAERIGLPLHVVDGESITQSFGVVRHDGAEASAFSSRRVIARDEAGRIFAARHHEYLIDIWSPSGGRLAGLEGPSLNAQPVLPGAYSDQNPPANRIWAIRPDSQKHLWVITWNRRPGWRELMRPVVDQQGRTRFEMKDAGTPFQDMFFSRIDVIDLNTLTLLARRDGPPMFISFIGTEGLAAAQEFTENGITRIGIWNVGLTPNGR